MAAILLHNECLPMMRGRVVVVTGSARGIGASTVEQLYKLGSHVVHGDLDSAAGEKLDRALKSDGEARYGTTHFVKTDVTSYDSILNLFEVAFQLFHRVDVAISNAGIQEIGNWFDPCLSLEDVKQVPSTKVIDVNLNGTLYFARIAVVYMRQQASESEDKSLIFVASSASFKETPGVFTYQASKHGVLGLMRSLRLYLPKCPSRIRVNAVCPWMTDTPMAAGIREAWIKAGLPMNSSSDVGRLMIEIAANKALNGKAVYMEGGRGWDIEEGIDRLESIWLGERQARDLVTGLTILEDTSNHSKTAPALSE